MSAPQVPQRPARSAHRHHPIAEMEVPKVPPRPNRHTSERSQSPPDRDHFPRSPFNEPPDGRVSGKMDSGPSMTPIDNSTETNLPKRPSSVSLPTIGQEGSEYAELEDIEAETVVDDKKSESGEAQETRNVAGDLPLHAPKPSFSKDTAKQRVAAVTRTDSGQAAAHGIGKAPTPSASADQERKRQVSFRPPSSASTERPSSAQYEEEQGIPEIGQRVPMYPDAGDVQAPSTSPFPQSPVGIGFNNSSYAKPGRHHRRTPSGREVLPPGSYGLHGHGVQSTDQFEQQWYAKHPEQLEKEEGEYGPGLVGSRHEWALSRDELNKLVRDTAKMNQSAVGPPNEQIGYEASEEYASRVETPHQGGIKPRSSSSQPTLKSPLRKSSFPVDPDAHVEIRKMQSHDSTRSMDHALESETEDEDLHVAPPAERRSKYTGNGYDASKHNLGAYGGNQDEKGGYIEETGYGVPILASDEVARTPGVEYLQPAISPAASRRGSAYFSGQEPEQSGLFRVGSRGGSAANSRPTSRPGSIHKLSMQDDEREMMHTPLEDVDEYEPLFPDEEGNKKPITAAQRLRMREQMRRFPSQDIWEDTPNSLQLQATVGTPEPTAAQIDPKPKGASAVFETPEQEGRRKREFTEEEKAKLLTKEERLQRSDFKPHIRDEMLRPGMKQRFPSKDIWEDPPDSAGLTAIIGGEAKSPPDAGLEAGAVVQTSAAPKEGIFAGEQTRDKATGGAPAMAKPDMPPRPYKKTPLSENLNQHPPIPARPPKRLHQVPPADANVPIAPSKLAESTSPTEAQETSQTEARKSPALPERGKPQIPNRPARPSPQEPSDPSASDKTTSAPSVGSEGSEKGGASGAPKPKPAVPARPAGGKIAALQGGFLADLNSRLKLGPQGPKPAEKEPKPEEEKVPLADARKGRAKGPSKRKAAAAASPAPAQSKPEAAVWSICQPVIIWQSNETGAVSLVQASTTPAISIQTEAAEDLKAKALSPEANPSGPETSAYLPTPLAEKGGNPLSVEPNTPVTESQAKGPIPKAENQTITPEVSEPIEHTDSKSQTGERESRVMAGTDQGEKPTTSVGGKSQAAEGEKGDEVVRG